MNPEALALRKEASAFGIYGWMSRCYGTERMSANGAVQSRMPKPGWPVFAAGALVTGLIGFGLGRLGSHSTAQVQVTSAESDVKTTPSASASVFAPPAYDVHEDPKFQVGAKLRPMDKEIFTQLANPEMTRERMEDVFPTLPFRVRIGGSASEHRYGLVMIDLTRDGTWDERWILDGAEVTRVVYTDAAAGGHEVTYNLRRGRWQVH